MNTEAMPILEGKFSQEEAQEVADQVADRIGEKTPDMTIRWAVEDAVLEAFGYKRDEDE